MNGGVGFAIDRPTVQIEATEAPELSVHDDRPHPLRQAELARLTKSLDFFCSKSQLRKRAKIQIGGEMLTHVGMGSSTAIRLGAVEALAVLNGVPFARGTLVAASGRGGTSGIGINSYFDGGLICDLGRLNEGLPFVPSSTACATSLPIALPAVPMPRWPLLLCIPREIHPKTQKEEIAFFERTTPLPPAASFEASYVALFEIYAAAIEANYAGFCRGIERMQQMEWKRLERAEYGSALTKLNTALLAAGADCAGMSSLGPMLFCFAEPGKLESIAETARTMGCDVHHATPANRGRQVRLPYA